MSEAGYGEGKVLTQIRCDDKTVYDNHLTRFIYSCHITSLKAYDASGVKCVCSDLKDFDQVYMLEYGHLSALEGAADNLAYDVVFVVGCSEKTLRKRILTRGERAGDWLDEDPRLTKWLKGTGVYKGSRDGKQEEYTRLRARTKVVRIDGEQSIADVCDQMDAILREVARAKGLAPNAPAAAPKPAGVGGAGAVEEAVDEVVEGAMRAVCARAHLRYVVRHTWQEGGYEELARTAIKGGGGKGGGGKGGGGKGGGGMGGGDTGGGGVGGGGEGGA